MSQKFDFFPYFEKKKIWKKNRKFSKNSKKKFFDFFFLKNEEKNQTFETLGLF